MGEKALVYLPELWPAIPNGQGHFLYGFWKKEVKIDIAIRTETGYDNLQRHFSEGGMR